MNNPTVSVIIPARNEQNNIGKLLQQILQQESNVFSLTEILVYSDGSTDKTVETATAVNSAVVRVLVGVESKGKVARLEEMFAEARGDIIIEFDADVQLVTGTVMQELVRAAQEEQAQLVSANVRPSAPKTFAEKMAYFGWDAWQEALRHVHPEPILHRSIGSARAFRREYFNGFAFPLDVASAEDTYCYLYAMQKKMKVVYAKDAMVYYRLPTTLGDYIKQMKRFMYNGTILKRYFDVAFIDREGAVSARAKLLGLLKTLLRYNPLVSMSYIVVQLYIHLFAKDYVSKAVWDLSASTKKFD